MKHGKHQYVNGSFSNLVEMIFSFQKLLQLQSECIPSSRSQCSSYFTVQSTFKELDIMFYRFYVRSMQLTNFNLPNRALELCPSFLTVPVFRSKTLPFPPAFGLPSCGCKFNCSRTFSTSSG